MDRTKPLKIPWFSLTNGRVAVDSGLGLSVQRLKQPVPFRRTPHRHDFYHVFWVEEGSGKLFIDGRPWPVAPASLHFVAPGQVHAWDWSQAPDGYVLCFEPALLFRHRDESDRLLQELMRTSGHGVVHPEFRSALKILFADLAEEYSSNRDFRAALLRSQMLTLLIRLRRLLAGQVSSELEERSTKLTTRFILLLQQDGGQVRRTEYYATNLLTTPRQLTEAVLAETGKSASLWIRDRVLQEANRLLTYTDLTISEIAHQLRFKNVPYFVRFFRRMTGLPPGQRREQGLKVSRFRKKV